MSAAADLLAALRALEALADAVSAGCIKGCRAHRQAKAVLAAARAAGVLPSRADGA